MKGRKNKNNKELKNRKDPEKKMEEKEKESTGSLNTSHEEFLLEIEEYAQKLRDDADNAEEKDITSSYEEDQELEIDNLHQIINDLRQELESEKTKVKDLNEIISNKNQVIKSLEENAIKDKYDEGPQLGKCRYWNKGFCKKGSKCHYIHPKEDCSKHLEEGKCEDQQCEGRHRKCCRYFNSKIGCYRGDCCQYLHSSNRKRETDNMNKRSEDSQELEKMFKCKQCDFQAPRNITLEKHINTKHVESPFNESISSFIYRLNLDKFASHYRDYFDWHGFTRREACHVEKMINWHGADFIMKDVEYQEDWSSNGSY